MLPLSCCGSLVGFVVGGCVVVDFVVVLLLGFVVVICRYCFCTNGP